MSFLLLLLPLIVMNGYGGDEDGVKDDVDNEAGRW